MQSGFVYDPSKGTFRSYLKTTVVRAIARRARQNRAITGLEGIEDSASAAGGPSGAPSDQPDEAWEQQWRQHHTRLAMKTVESEFNATDLEAFQRYALLQHDVQAVARDLKVSVDSVYQAKSRIVRRLSKLIADQVAEEG
jgi:RNA polymerase sigma-70 factor (ECF subfamily)